MSKNSFKLILGSGILLVLAIIFYVLGLNINNVHMVAWSTEVGGAGLVGVVIGFINQLL